MLEKEYTFYRNNMDAFNAKYPNRFIVIKDENVIGDYETIEQAMEAGLELFEPGTFLVHHCIPEEEQTMRFYSRRVNFEPDVQYL